MKCMDSLCSAGMFQFEGGGSATEKRQLDPRCPRPRAGENHESVEDQSGRA